MFADDVTQAVREIPENVVTQVAVNTNDIKNVKDDIHDIRDDIKSFRKEAREDSKATRQAMLSFAVAVSIPILVAAFKLAFFS